MALTPGLDSSSVPCELIILGKFPNLSGPESLYLIIAAPPMWTVVKTSEVVSV